LPSIFRFEGDQLFLRSDLPLQVGGVVVQLCPKSEESIAGIIISEAVGKPPASLGLVTQAAR
jgi:hypothetical protein